jgi:hypothetical protein
MGRQETTRKTTKNHAAVHGNAVKQEFVEEFDGNMAHLGIIPKSLERLVKAMGAIPAVAKATADKIAILIQTAIRKDLTERRKEIDKTRKAKKLYQQHACGRSEEAERQQESEVMGLQGEGESPSPGVPHIAQLQLP